MENFTKGCPGANNIRGAPTLKEKTCPNCGAVIEMFSNEPAVQCKCGFTAYNDIQSCITWCAFARECVGDEVYEKMIQTTGNMSSP